MAYNVSAKVSRNGLVGKAVCLSLCCTLFYNLMILKLSFTPSLRMVKK